MRKGKGIAAELIDEHMEQVNVIWALQDGLERAARNLRSIATHEGNEQIKSIYDAWARDAEEVAGLVVGGSTS